MYIFQGPHLRLEYLENNVLQLYIIITSDMIFTVFSANCFQPIFEKYDTCDRSYAFKSVFPKFTSPKDLTG
jgi:hypothetical protein